MSNSVNFYEFIGFITFNVEVDELVYVYSFLVDGILVSNVPRATVRRRKRISVNNVLINYVDKLKYLGCVLVSAKSYKVSLHEMRVKFYKSFNSLYSKCVKFSEPVLLHLINAHCKPFFLYGMEAVNLNNRELNTLNYTYSNGICKIFKASHCSVEDILHFTQEPSIKDCWMSRKTRLVQKGLTVKNTVVNFM